MANEIELFGRLANMISEDAKKARTVPMSGEMNAETAGANAEPDEPGDAEPETEIETETTETETTETNESED